MTEKSGKDVKVTTGKGAEIEKATPSRAMSPFEEMDRFFEDMFPRRWLRGLRREWPAWGDLATPFEGKMPRVDVIDREDEILVRAEVPGVDKKDLEVSLTDNAVTIKGSTRHEEKEEKGDFYRSEISRGSFSRTVALPGEVDGDKAKASFKDGVVEIAMPKLEASKRRSIKVE
jgi:HSP20 family protein